MKPEGEPQLTRVCAGEDGGTLLLDLVVPGPPRTTAGGATGRVLFDVPVTTMHMTVTDRRRPPMPLHPAPRRQLVIVLHGAFEITTTDGTRRRFGAGDCLLADDVGSRGHTYEDVGDVPLVTLAIGIGNGWEWPDAPGASEAPGAEPGGAQ